MAELDIMPYDSPHGGHSRIQEFRLNASETLLRGEPCAINASGELTQSGDNPVALDMLGIAATGGDTTAGTGSIDPDTGDVITTGGMVKVYMPSQDQLFITPNFTQAGTAFGDVAPDANDLGLEVGLTLIGGSWGLDVAGTEEICRIMDVLDADGNSVQRSGATGTRVIFSIVAHENTTTVGNAGARVA